MRGETRGEIVSPVDIREKKSSSTAEYERLYGQVDSTRVVRVKHLKSKGQAEAHRDAGQTAVQLSRIDLAADSSRLEARLR